MHVDNHQLYLVQIALVAQEPVLYAQSVRDNIAYALDGVDDDQIIQTAKMANAHEFVIETDKGYKTNVGEKGVQLSGKDRNGGFYHFLLQAVRNNELQSHAHSSDVLLYCYSTKRRVHSTPNRNIKYKKLSIVISPVIPFY